MGFAEPPSDGPPTKPGVRPTAGGTGAPSLLRHRFPSKAGGAPAWLDPLRLPPRAALACPHTGAPYRFLLQVYAPDEAAGDRAFHRALFLFVSPSVGRLSRGEPGAARAFRCQLPRRNRYYGYHPGGGGDGDAALTLLVGAEREVALERDPWRVARREAVAAGAEAADAADDGGDGDGPEPFRETELVVEPEPDEDDADDVMAEVARVQQQQQERSGATATAAAAGATPAAPAAAGSGGVGRAAVARLLADYERRARDEGALTDDDLPPDLMDELERALGRERAAFARFQARVARAPSQVLRYCFSEGAAPLWPSASRVPGARDIPPCGRCGGPRRFEFQVRFFVFVLFGVFVCFWAGRGRGEGAEGEARRARLAPPPNPRLALPRPFFSSGTADEETISLHFDLNSIRVDQQFNALKPLTSPLSFRVLRLPPPPLPPPRLFVFPTPFPRPPLPQTPLNQPPQVMPQLLSYLGVDEDDPSAPDWGTIAVYSCAASCGGGGGGGGGATSVGGDGDGCGNGGGGDDSAYAEEFVWVQPPATA